jgi:threonine dehydrogenase-like Zn-dependent dehydrogenase
MLAAVMRNARLDVATVADPEPGPGQLLVRTRACGICGSDLHALQHGPDLVAMADEAAGSAGGDLPLPMINMDLSRDVVMGHEFVGEVLAAGAGATAHAVGDLVVSMPVAFDAVGLHQVGYSNHYPGGYGEQMVLNDDLALTVPNGLSARLAALTEPMAVGVHAVNRSGIEPGTAAVVLGCGPVGLAVVAALVAKGIEPIVAADFSPTRRALAAGLGAHRVVDPAEAEPVAEWREADGTHPLVIFEAVGVPGMIDQAMRTAPRLAQVLVVGVCMLEDTIRPLRGIARELDIRFALGYDPLEFAGTLRSIAEGELDVAPLITGTVPIEDVPAAFAALADPDAHAKILVEPGATSTL